MRKILFIFFCIAATIYSCRTGKIASTNLSYLYDQDMVHYIPEYKVYHVNDTVSRMYYRFNSDGLLYVKEVNEDHFSANYSVKLELFDSYSMKVVYDSLTEEFTDDNKDLKRDIYGFIDIKARAGNDYLLKMIFSDLKKNTSVELYIEFLKETKNSAQNFLLMDADSLPVFSSTVDSAAKYRLLCNNTLLDKIFIGYYDRIFPIATPPFSFTESKPFEYTADSIFTVNMNFGISDELEFHPKGFYHLQTDTAQTKGITLFRYDEDFPKIASAEQMLYPIRYLTSRSEYEDLILMKDKKKAVETFWLDLGGNAARAKEMIKLYYNRVQSANLYFSSYLEGWKTDRGIIYIIYGTPNVVYRSKEGESWVYGEDRNLLSITFTFSKVENPFTDNDYKLSRSPAYKDGWYIAVDNWRR